MLEHDDALVEAEEGLLGDVRGQSEAAELNLVAATSHALEDEKRPMFTAQLPFGKLAEPLVLRRIELPRDCLWRRLRKRYGIEFWGVPWSPFRHESESRHYIKAPPRRNPVESVAR